MLTQTRLDLSGDNRSDGTGIKSCPIRISAYYLLVQRGFKNVRRYAGGLLGLGWNFCFVGGSTLLSDQLSHAERAKTQGANEWLLGLATAAASLGSGLVFALTSFTAIGILGAALALVPLGLTGWWLVRGRRPAEAWL